MTRRDYLNATLLGSGAFLLRCPSPAQIISPSDWDGYGGVGDYSHSNGNTWDVLSEGHKIRDAAFHPESAPVIDTGESYDCVVVGGGISGLAAALFFARQAGPQRTCLVLDDHAIFGGLAKRNEFLVDGQRVIANQASAMFFPQHPGTFLDGFYQSIGIDSTRFVYQKWTGNDAAMPVGQTPYFEGGKNSAFFFGKKFGQPRGLLLTDPWGHNLEGAPISPDTRRELLRTRHSSEAAAEDALPQKHGDALSRRLDSITLEEYLMERYGISRDTVRTFLSPVAGGGSGIGADALSAYADVAADVLLPWDQTDGAQMFPGGNAGVARHILKALIPDAIPGPATMQGVCRARVNFAALDRAAFNGAPQRSRVRLRTTVASLEHAQSSRVKITYSTGGKLYSVSAANVVMAGGSWTAKHIIPDLPALHRDAYAQFYRSPALVANVALRNWRFLYKIGISECQWFEGIGNYAAIRKLATFGDVPATISPDSPVALTLKILFSYPGLPLAEQNRKGREELLSTSYKSYEQQIRNHFAEMFGNLGFDAKRDIAGIILNRWGHAYLTAQPGFFFGANGQPGPGDVLRQNPFGRITFANSDLSGIMDHRASILEAERAVRQVLARSA